MLNVLKKNKIISKIIHTSLLSMMAFFSLAAVADDSADNHKNTTTLPSSAAEKVLHNKLLNAAIEEDFGQVKALMKKGAQITVKHAWKDNHTPLTAALASGFGPIAQYMLDHDNSEPTERALFYAARLGDLTIVKTILDRLGLLENTTARPDRGEDKKSITSRYFRHCGLDQAAKNGHLEVVKLLYPISRESCGYPIGISIKNNQMSVVKWLLSQRSDDEEPTIFQKNSWMREAIKSDNLEMLRFVKGLGINLEEQIDRFAEVAAKNNKVVALKYLVEQGYQLDSNPNVYSSLIMSAIYGGSEKVLDYLISQKVSFNKPQACSPPLHYAAKAQQRAFFFKLAKLDTPAIDPCFKKNPLHIAFIGKNSEKNLFLLDYNPKWRLAKDSEGNTPLHYAVKRNATDVIPDLLKLGGINIQNNKGQTPLMLAMGAYDSRVLGRVFSAGSDLSLTDEEGKTALHYLVDNGYMGIDRFDSFFAVLSKEQINAQDAYGFNALMTIISRQYKSSYSYDLIQKLIGLGADQTPPKSGETARDFAIKFEDQKLFKLLGIEPPESFTATTAIAKVEEVKPEKASPPINLQQYPSRQNNTALHASVRARSIAAVNYVLENNIAIDEQNAFGDSALQLAIKLGESRLVNRLLEVGANINLKNRDGRTPLHIALAYKHWDIASTLIQQGADVNAISKGGWTPLHFAAVTGNKTIVNELLKKGANPSRKNWGDNTPVSLATEASYSVIAALLNKSPSVALSKDTDTFGNTSLIRAVQNLDIVEVKKQLTPGQINAKNIYHETALSTAILESKNNEKNALSIVQLLIKSGADIELKDQYGSTALHFSLYHSAPSSIIQLLLDEGAEIDTQDKFGITVVQMPCYSGDTTLLGQLLDKKPDFLNRKFSEQQSLLHIATLHKQPYILKLLINRGIKLNEVTESDYTALNVAIINQQEALVKILVEAGADLEHHPSALPSILLTSALNKQFSTVMYLVDKGAKLDQFSSEEPLKLFNVLAEYKGTDSGMPQFIDKMVSEYQLFKMPEFKSEQQEQLIYSLLKEDAAKQLKRYQKLGLSIPLKKTLHEAVSVDAVNIIKQLAGPLDDLNQLNNRAETLLHTAVTSQSMEATKWLATQQTKLDINLRDDNKLTAMDKLKHRGFSGDETAYPALFLEHFPDAEYSPDLLGEIINTYRYKVAKLLLERRSFDVTGVRLASSVMLGYSDGTSEEILALLRLLLSKGATLPPMENIYEYSSGWVVSRPKLFEFFLSKQPSLPSKKNQWPVLSELVTSDNLKSLELLGLLRDKGWNLKVTDKDGNNLLHRFNGQYFSGDQQALMLEKFNFLRSELGGRKALYQENKKGQTPLQLVINNARLYEQVPALFEQQVPALAGHPKALVTGDMAWLFSLEKRPTLKRLLKLPSLKASLLKLSLPGTLEAGISPKYLKSAFSSLISLGADPSAVDRQGNTLAHNLLGGLHCRYNTKNCLAGLKYLKALGVDFSVANQKKMTPLNLAISKLGDDNLSILEYLLENGASPNIKLANGDTPLHLAAAKTQAKQRQLIKALLIAGADINAQNNVGDTPFHLALRNKNAAAINYLLSAGKLKDLQNTLQRTPLHELVTLGNIDWVKRYLEIVKEQKASLSQQDILGNTALHELVLQPCSHDRCKVSTDIARLLLANGIAIDVVNKNNETALFMTAYSGNLALAKLLHSKVTDGDINHLNRIGNAPVHIAYYQKHAAFLEWLLTNGGDWTLKNWEGNSIQHWMVTNKDYALALLAQSLSPSEFDWHEGLKAFELSENRLNSPKLLYSMLKQKRLAVAQVPELTLGKMVDFQDEDTGNTLLHIAAQNDYPITVKQLLTGHHPVDWGNKDKETPLNLASKESLPEVIETLLSFGASPNIQNEEGTTPLIKAVRHNQLELAATMIKSGANLALSDLKQRSALLTAVETGNLEIVSLLLKSGAAINAAEEKGHSPLVHAVWYYVTQMKSASAELKNRIKLIDLLIANGADIDARDELGRTALHISMPIYQLAKHLLAKGATANTQSSNKESPLFQAIRTNYPQDNTGIDFIRALVRAGANVNERNKAGITPLSLAVNNSRIDLIPVLVELGSDANMRTNGIPLVSQLIGHSWINRQGLIEELLKHKLDLNVHDNLSGIKGKTPLQHAIEKGGLSLSRFLIKSGSDPSLVDNSGKNALHTLASQKNQEPRKVTESLIKAMIAAGLDINAVDYNNRTALHHAVSFGSESLVESLLAQGINPNIQSIGDFTALQLALHKSWRGEDRHELIDQLIDMTDLNIRDAEGKTLLHWAYAYKDEKLVKKLIAAGIDVTIRDYKRQLAK